MSRWWPGLALGCVAPTPGPTGTDNVILIVLDDVGIDKVGAYGVHPEVAPTPTFDRLAEEGMRFGHAYASPTCTATRAALLTGRHARRTGMGAVIWPFDTTWELPLEEQTLPEVLAPEGISSALAGKWHLSSNVSEWGEDLPLLQGFDWFAGSMNNLWVDSDAEGPGHGFFEFEKVQASGRIRVVERYATTDTTDDALDQALSLPEPFFLMVSYNAAHNPWHTPPVELHSFGADPGSHVLQHLAATEALDTEIGRLLDGLPIDLQSRTWVIVVGDNGTPGPVAVKPSHWQRAKGSVYEGGVRVPMVVRGPGVPAGVESDALFHVVDLLPTIARIVEAPLGERPIDGVDQLDVWTGRTDAVRELVYHEDLVPTGPGPWSSDTRALHDGSFKIVRQHDGTLELYDMRDVPFEEGVDLLAGGALDEPAQAALERLSTALEATVAELVP